MLRPRRRRPSPRTPVTVSVSLSVLKKELLLTGIVNTWAIELEITRAVFPSLPFAIDHHRSYYFQTIRLQTLCWETSPFNCGSHVLYIFGSFLES